MEHTRVPQDSASRPIKRLKAVVPKGSGAGLPGFKQKRLIMSVELPARPKPTLQQSLPTSPSTCFKTNDLKQDMLYGTCVTQDGKSFEKEAPPTELSSGRFGGNCQDSEK